MPRPVPLRGVIEGFYGPPWSPAARFTVIEFLADRGMNAYVYAPKSDPKHRDRWRDPYDASEMRHFRELAEHSTGHGTRFGFALAPGLDIRYRDDRDRDTLLQKLLPLCEAGVDWIVLALDDIPNRPGLASDQADLTAWLLDALRDQRPDARLTLVPTEYVGTRRTPYLGALAVRLPPDVDVMWTGPTVCSPVIRAADARAWAAALAERRPLLWDNYPVNDGAMARSLHLGPYRGREPDLTDEVEGVLCNPMLQAHASQIALATAADFLAAPEAYDPDGSWSRAIAAVGRSRTSALGALAAACADGPLLSPERLEAHTLVTVLADTAGSADWPDALGAVRDHLAAVQRAGRAWADAGADPLADELEPWLAAAAKEADAGLAALRLIQQTYPVGCVYDDGSGKVVGADAELAVLHAFAVVFSWSAARRHDRVVFGPRFAVYPAVVQLDDGRPGLDVDLAVVEGQSAIDRLCRLALARYRDWMQRPPAQLRVTVDGAAVDVAPDGAFDVPGGGAGVVVVETGGDATALRTPEAALPFPDPRLD